MNRTVKRGIGLLLSAMLLVPAAHAEQSQEITVLIQEQKVQFDQPPVMMNDRVMVPLRAVSEALGCDVHWYESTQTIGIGRDGGSLDDVLLKVGYPKVLKLTLNCIVDSAVEIDQPPVVLNDRTLVPVRALSQALGAEVGWDEETQTVTVGKPGELDMPEFQDGFAIVKKGIYTGVMKDDGTMLIPAQYDNISQCGKLFVASKDYRVAMSTSVEIIDLDGNIIMEGLIKPEILYAFGHLCVKWTDYSSPMEDGSYQKYDTVFDEDGNKVLDGEDQASYDAFVKETFPAPVTRIDSYGVEESGLVKAEISTEEGVRYGFLDADCKKVVIPFTLKEVNSFQGGVAAFREDGLWGLIGTSGKVIVQPRYEEIGPMADGLAIIKRDGKWGFIDMEGNEVIQPQYEGGLAFDQNADLTSVQQNGKWGAIDRTGAMVIPFQYDELFQWNEDLAVVLQGETYGVINKNNEMIIPAQFDYCSSFSDGLAVVRKNAKEEGQTDQYGVIDRTGAFRIEYGMYPHIGEFGFLNGYVTVTFKDQQSGGIMDETGEILECHQLIWP